MKPQELRIGNFIYHNGTVITIVGVNLGGIEYKLPNDDQIYVRSFSDVLLQPIPITEEWTKTLGLEKHNGVLPSYEMIIPHASFYKSLSIQYNNDSSVKQYYCWFREGDLSKDRMDDSIVCLKKNLKYVHELQNLCFELVGENK